MFHMQQESLSGLYKEERTLPILRKQDTFQTAFCHHKSQGKMISYTLELKAHGNTDEIYRCFQSEATKRDRAELEITKKDDHVVFDIKAKDITALSATINSIIKLFTVYEKTSR